MKSGIQNMFCIVNKQNNGNINSLRLQMFAETLQPNLAMHLGV